MPREGQLTKICAMERPRIVSTEEWQQARDDLLTSEKEAPRAQGALQRLEIS